LYTGLKTIRSISARAGGLTQESAESPEEQVRIIPQIINESHARYFVATATDYEQEDQAEPKREALKVLIEENPDKFVPVFESINGRARIYRIEHTT
jgi:negative regulator of replication initiation